MKFRLGWRVYFRLPNQEGWCVIRGPLLRDAVSNWTGIYEVELERGGWSFISEESLSLKP